MEPGQAKDMLDTLLHELYEVPILVVYNNIAKIVDNNIELVLNIPNDSAVRYVRFNGKIYFSANLPEYRDRQSVIYDTNIPNRSMVMHDTTKELLIPEIKELKDLETEQKECAHYLRNLLNQCNSVQDVEAVLPDAAWNLLNINLVHWQLSSLTLSDSDLKSIQDTYAEESATIKERIFLNLLLRKV